MNRELNSPIYTLDWGQIHQTLDDQGFAKLPVLLTPEQCQNFINL